jgi:hypothetical protein
LKTRTVVPFPDRGHKRPDLTSRPLRFIVVRGCLTAYASQEIPRVMAAIRRGREDRTPPV